MTGKSVKAVKGWAIVKGDKIQNITMLGFKFVKGHCGPDERVARILITEIKRKRK